MSKVEDFLKNGGYEVTKSGKNPFNNIEMEGIPVIKKKIMLVNSV